MTGFGNQPLPVFSRAPRTRLSRVLNYLGWVNDSSVPNKYEIWTRQGRDRLLVPLDTTKGDYEALLAKALRVLEVTVAPQVLARTTAAVDSEIKGDLVPVRWSREASTPPGTIPLEDGLSAHLAVARALGSAARATVQPGPTFGKRNSFVAQDYLRRVVLAPSGVGSYVLTTLAPVNELVFLKAPPPLDSSDRTDGPRSSIASGDVLLTLHSALTVVHDAVRLPDGKDSVQALLGSVDRGISKELLGALSEFIGEDEAAVTVPRVGWADADGDDEFSFTPSHRLVLGLASEDLARTDQPATATYTGAVVQLKRENRHEPTGTVRIITTSRENVRSLVVELESDDYERAVRAHEQGAMVRVTGKLFRPGRSWKMESPLLEVLDLIESDAELLDDGMAPLFPDFPGQW